MTGLDLADGSLAGVVAWYSLIHTPPNEQHVLLGEIARVLRPGGRLLVATQVGGDERVHLDRAYGHELSLDVYRLDPDALTDRLRAAGLSITARLAREPEDRERQPQTFLFAQKPPTW